MHAKLIKADFHGSIMTGAYPVLLPQCARANVCVSSAVRQSKNPCLVGLSGIVVHETENAFKVITQSDVLKSGPSSCTLLPEPRVLTLLRQ